MFYNLGSTLNKQNIKCQIVSFRGGGMWIVLPAERALFLITIDTYSSVSVGIILLFVWEKLNELAW